MSLSELEVCRQTQLQNRGAVAAGLAGLHSGREITRICRWLTVARLDPVGTRPMGNRGAGYAEGVGQLQPRVSYPGISRLNNSQTLKEFARRSLTWRIGQHLRRLYPSSLCKPRVGNIIEKCSESLKGSVAVEVLGASPFLRNQRVAVDNFAVGHYCRICHRRRANERFSGKGHRDHICKDCLSSSLYDFFGIARVVTRAREFQS
jgi:hypothetical protein